MILVLRMGAAEAEVSDLKDRVASLGTGPAREACLGSTRIIRVNAGDAALSAHPAVARTIPSDLPYALASRDVHPEPTRVKVGKSLIGGERVVLAAGPCAVEGRDQLRRAAEAAVRGGASILRGGAFKPRTSWYSFQGLGEAGLDLLADTAREFGLAVVTEVMSPEQVPVVAARADMLQVGSRSIQNFPLLDAVGRSRKPVLLKRGMMSQVDELLASAEYVLSRGNPDVVLCERGIRTFEPRTRNTFDVVAIPLLKELTHLPVFADPSHATGRASLVGPAARAAVAAGADGLLIEIHHDPGKALSDGAQALRPEAFFALAGELEAVARAVGRPLERAGNRHP